METKAFKERLRELAMFSLYRRLKNEIFKYLTVEDGACLFFNLRCIGLDVEVSNYKKIFD